MKNDGLCEMHTGKYKLSDDDEPLGDDIWCKDKATHLGEGTPPTRMCDGCAEKMRQEGFEVIPIDEKPVTEPAGYHATVNFKVHLSHQVLCLNARDTPNSIDSKIVAQAVATAVEALTGPAVEELPNLRLYLHGCMVTADIEETRWLEQVPEPVRVWRCQSSNCRNDILQGADQFFPFCSAACTEQG